MATTYKNYDQAKAAYDGLVAAKDRALRNNEIQRAQTLKGVDRRILQNGITGGHQETTDLLARSAANSNAVNIGLQYDPEIASLYAQMKALQQPISSGVSGRGSAGSVKKAANTSGFENTTKKYAQPSASFTKYGAGGDGRDRFYIGPQIRENAIRF